MAQPRVHHAGPDASATGEAITSSLLDAMSVCAIIADTAGTVRMASAAGEAMLGRAGSAVLLRPAPTGGAGSRLLVARHQADSALLRRMIASAASGGPGGTLRLHATDDGAMQVAVVAPLPGGSKDRPGLALIRIEDLVGRALPPTQLLSDLFDLTRAEAEVAVGLVGGASAEQVAASRGASVDTVRSQIRSILRKCEAANLRDLERILARLAFATA
jgi:DNA-binding CsgD family transcriptional regulator